MSAIAYKIFVCDGGHQWDVFGHENDDEKFVPDNLRLYLCPACDELMVEEREPENLT